MKNLLNSLDDNLKELIYEYDGNDYNRNVFNKVIQELNMKRLKDFIKYNIFIDTKYICWDKSKISRIYIMDMIRNDDFKKYTDYNTKLIELKTFLKEPENTMNKLEIAKNLMNYEELYIYLMDMMKGVEEEFVEDFYFDFVINNNYFDKRIMKNEVYENFEISTDTENEFESENESDNWTDESDDNETYYETDEEPDEENY